MKLLVVHDCFWVQSEPGLVSTADEYVQPLVVYENFKVEGNKSFMALYC